MEKLYADIIINISHEALDKVFAYKVPFSMIKDIRVGQQVVVPFGRSNKEQTGYVVNLSRTVDYDESKVKEILRIETDHVGGVKYDRVSCVDQRELWINNDPGIKNRTSSAGKSCTKSEKIH